MSEFVFKQHLGSLVIAHVELFNNRVSQLMKFIVCDTQLPVRIHTAKGGECRTADQITQLTRAMLPKQRGTQRLVTRPLHVLTQTIFPHHMRFCCGYKMQTLMQATSAFQTNFTVVN